MRNEKQYLTKTATCILASAISLAGVSIAQADWLTGGMGSIPTNAIIGGNEASGQYLYICRANYGGGIHPGKIRREFSACNIPWGGKEISAPIYQVAAKSGQSRWSWQNGFGGSIPNGAVHAGNEANGEALYLCRANIKGGTHPGKIKLGFSGCNIPYGGKEMTIISYQVMVGVI